MMFFREVITMKFCSIRKVKVMRKLRDSDIRNVLASYLISWYSNDPDTIIVNEMGVIHGQSRVDMAVINGILHGYEIKSESDNLLRLPSQINDYNKVFDRMTIVVQRSHLNEVKETVPKWWGIILVTRSNGQINLRNVRKGRKNPEGDAFSISQLLWRDEALEVLKRRGLHKGYLSKPRKIIYRRICETLDLEEIKFTVNEQLKIREGWRHHLQPQTNDDLLQQ
jgi:hypothetical protein